MKSPSLPIEPPPPGGPPLPRIELENRPPAVDPRTFAFDALLAPPDVFLLELLGAELVDE
jgi:hypothetical protein